MRDAEEVHAELISIAADRNRMQVRQAGLLVMAEELELWRKYNCAHMCEYLERYCDLQPRTSREYLRVARALSTLPLTRAALETDRIRYSAARELTRIVTPETEAEWLSETAGMSAREIEDELAGRERGDRPHDPRDPDRLVTLTLHVRESTFATFLDARRRYIDDAGERFSDDEVVLAMCRGGLPGDIAVEVNVDDESVDDDAAIAMGEGSVEHDTNDTSGTSDTNDVANGRGPVSRGGGGGDGGGGGPVPPYQLSISTCRSCRRSFQITAGRELEVTAAILAMAQCDARFIGDLESDTPQRALKSVTPRMREQVMTRDGYACTVPGCRSKRCLDVHHITPQAAGGPNLASNLTTLCWGHHRQLHEQRLAVVGHAPSALRFTWPAEPTRTSTRSGGPW